MITLFSTSFNFNMAITATCCYCNKFSQKVSYPDRRAAGSLFLEKTAFKSAHFLVYKLFGVGLCLDTIAKMNSFSKGQEQGQGEATFKGKSNFSTFSSALCYSSIIKDKGFSTDWLKEQLKLPNKPLYLFNYLEALNPSNRVLLSGISGIYAWYTPIEGGKLYIGSAKNLNERPFTHIAKKGPKNKKFKELLSLYGLTSFYLVIFEIDQPTELVVIKSLLEKEQFYLDTISLELQLNLSRKANAPRGSFKRTEEFKNKLSKSQFGELNTNYGKKATPATLEKLRLAKADSFRSIHLEDLKTGEMTFFESIAALVRFTQIPRSTVQNALNKGTVLRGKWRVRGFNENSESIQRFSRCILREYSDASRYGEGCLLQVLNLCKRHPIVESRRRIKLNKYNQEIKRTFL
jgi:hypothetical protein